LKGRDVSRRGLRWRVGTSDAISLWFDPWLPSTTQSKIQSPVIQEFAVAQVSFLNPITKL